MFADATAFAGVVRPLPELGVIGGAMTPPTTPSSWKVTVRFDPWRTWRRKPIRYGLGFWLPPPDGTVMLEGADAGVSFRSVLDRNRDTTFTVVSNTTDGAWPLVRRLEELLG